MKTATKFTKLPTHMVKAGVTHTTHPSFQGMPPYVEQVFATANPEGDSVYLSQSYTLYEAVQAAMGLLKSVEAGLDVNDKVRRGTLAEVRDKLNNFR